MKISGIDKDIEEIIYYLDEKGFKPYASCDGVIENHKEKESVGQAYIAFLKSSRIIELMSVFLRDKENFCVTISSEEYLKPHELYGNTISGTTYQVSFSNKYGERTTDFESIIKNTVVGKEDITSEEKTKLEILDKVLGANPNSNIAFNVIFNTDYQPYMNKSGKINELRITTKVGDEKLDGDIILRDEIDMKELANILSAKYNMEEKEEFSQEYTETEFICAQSDKCSCSIYFTDDHLPQIIERIQYVRDIENTLPRFVGEEYVGNDDIIYEEEYEEMWELEDDFIEEEVQEEKTSLEQREAMLCKLEKNEEILIKLEQMLRRDRPKDENSIGE